MKPTIAGISILVILIGIYVYMYLTLPNLKEHFANQSKAEKEMLKQHDELKNTYKKNRFEVQELNYELKRLKRELQLNEKNKNKDIYNNSLLEYDVEKANASYNLVKMGLESVRSYYANLQKEYLRVGKELSTLKEQYALDKEKCSLVDTSVLKLTRDHETVVKERHTTTIQIEELKKQLDLMVAKKDPLATTLTQVLKERQDSRTALDKKLSETSQKMKQGLAKAEELNKKLSKDKDALEKVKKQHDVAERQLVQIEAKIKEESKSKKERTTELDQVKQSITIREKINNDLQKDVDSVRAKYNKVIGANTTLTNKINKQREENLKDSAEIKKLQDAIAAMKAKQLQEAAALKQQMKAPCSKPVSYLPLTVNSKDMGSNPQSAVALGNVQFTTVAGRKCAYFNNRMDTYIKLPNTVKSTFTVSFWFLLKSRGYYTMVSLTDPTLNDPLIQFDLDLPGKLAGPYLGLPNRWTGTSSKTRLELNSWHHVTLVVNGSRATSYINGEKEGEASGSSPMPNRPFWIIGRSGDGGRAADVCVAHFSVWDRNLMESEIQSYFKETAGNNLPDECPKVSTINIIEASYGKNCNASLKGNRTPLFKGLADGKSSLEYTYNYTRTGGDPAGGCGKTLDIVYTCGSGGEKTFRAPAEAGLDSRVVLKC